MSDTKDPENPLPDLPTAKFIEFGKTLMDSEIPSFGPETGMLMLKIMGAVQKEVAKAKKTPGYDPVVLMQLERYRDALNEIVVVGALHQKMAINKLAMILGINS